MTKKYDYLVFIGRFQPFHNGHKEVVDQALAQSHEVILVVGSANQPRTARNPLTFHERAEIIRAAYPIEEHERIHIIPQEDHLYNDDKWTASINGGVGAVTNRVWKAGPTSIGLIGHNKDHTSYYLNKFPNWGSIAATVTKPLDATHIRNKIYESNYLNENKLNSNMSHNAADRLIRLIINGSFELPQKEYNILEKYRNSWKDSPYPPIFQTVDSIVVQSGHILLITRKSMPGEGLLALPGGFINEHELLIDAMIRELREETKIKVPENVLRGSIAETHVFDHPYRSQRGRTITTGYYIKLREDPTLPKVRGSDDAAKATWVPLNEVRRDKMFEDHYDIIEYFTGI